MLAQPSVHGIDLLFDIGDRDSHLDRGAIEPEPRRTGLITGAHRTAARV